MPKKFTLKNKRVLPTIETTNKDRIEGKHYQGKIETWDWLVQLCHSLREANVSDEELLGCIFAQKYLSTRIGHKKGESIHDDLFKITNYMHKGTFGTWIKDEVNKNV